MTVENFEKCLAITLKWEGGYSNHPDDPGGPTMRGIIQREYDAWRRKKGSSARPVRQIEEAEVRAIYRDEYWDAMGCDGLPAGLDLCVFDAAVNSGAGRAREWLNHTQDIDGFCDERLAFLQRLGRLWRIFGAGWSKRVAGIRHEAHIMADHRVPSPPDAPDTLHAGMKGERVLALQRKLRELGYPAGAVDGVFGAQTHRAVILFQQDHDLTGEPGVWQPVYDRTLAAAEPMLPGRKEITHRDLEEAGDPPIRRMNMLQRIFAWLFGTSAMAQAFGGSSLVESMDGVRSAFEPVQDLIYWASSNKWLFLAAGCIGAIALIRLLRHEHVQAYRNFDYQGAPQAAPFSKTETLS